MIYSFDYPHKIGSVCGPGCPTCDAAGPVIENPYMTDEYGNPMPLQPLYILREATYEEQVAEMRALVRNPNVAVGKYYYEVSTD